MVIHLTAWVSPAPCGGLFPRLFPLTAAPARARRGGLFSVTLSIGRDFRPGPPRPFPRHAALWCSDFPLPPRRERPSTPCLYTAFSRRSQAGFRLLWYGIAFDQPGAET